MCMKRGLPARPARGICNETSRQWQLTYTASDSATSTGISWWPDPNSTAATAYSSSGTNAAGGLGWAIR